MDNIIFYFSGTGNSLYVANKLAAAIGDCGVEAVADYESSRKITAKRIGIVFPVYNYGLPNIVIKFINNLQVTGKPYFFAAYTYGDSCGIAADMARKMTKERGWTLNAAFGFRLPQNYILEIFRVPDEKTQKARFQKADERFPSVAKMILSNETYFEREPLRFKLIRSFAYKLHAGRAKQLPVKDMDFIVSDQCSGCGLCAKGCPVKNIAIETARPAFTHHCEFCFQCIHVCPKTAINYRTETCGRKRYRNPMMK